MRNPDFIFYGRFPSPTKNKGAESNHHPNTEQTIPRKPRDDERIIPTLEDPAVLTREPPRHLTNSDRVKTRSLFRVRNWDLLLEEEELGLWVGSPHVIVLSSTDHGDRAPRVNGQVVHFTATTHRQVKDELLRLLISNGLTGSLHHLMFSRNEVLPLVHLMRTAFDFFKTYPPFV